MAKRGYDGPWLYSDDGKQIVGIRNPDDSETSFSGGGGGGGGGGGLSAPVAKSSLAADVQASLAAADRMAALPLGPILLLAKDNAQASRASANAGADNVYQVMKSFLLPGGSMGKNGTLHWDLEASLTSSASTKEFALRIGGTLISPAWSLTTSATEQRSGKLHANNSQAAQKFRATTAIQGGSAQGYTTTAIDLTVDQTVELVCRWGAASVAGETIAIEVLRAWVEYGA